MRGPSTHFFVSFDALPVDAARRFVYALVITFLSSSLRPWRCSAWANSCVVVE